MNLCQFVPSSKNLLGVGSRSLQSLSSVEGSGGESGGEREGTRTEVPPTLIHPASQQGGRGEVEKPDRRSQGGDGGEMGKAGIFGSKKGKVVNLNQHQDCDLEHLYI